MAITINLYGYQALTESINQLIPVNSFIRKMFFTREITFPTKTVVADIVVNGRKLAPFVARGQEAVVVGKLGQQAKSFEPPMIRFKKDFTANDLFFTRSPGDAPFIPGAGGNTIETARRNKISLEQQDMMDRANRTIEYMCIQSLTGSYTMEQETGGSFAIDFNMPVANKPVLAGAAKWDDPKADPIDTISKWKIIAKKSGKTPTITVMNSTTFSLFINSAVTLSKLDKLKYNPGSINTEASISDMGAEFKGIIDGVRYYTYDEIYEDKDGATQYMIPDGYVILGTPAADFRILFGAIEDLKGTVQAKFFSKDWITEDPSIYWLLAESHPLPIVGEPGSVIYGKVA